MEKRLPLILQTLLILCVLGITTHAQPVLVTQIPEGSTNFENIGDLVYFTVGNALWRTDGTAQGTFELKTGFTGFSEFNGFDGKLFFRSGKIPQENQVAWNEIWASDGTPAGTVLLKRSAFYNVTISGATTTYLFFQASEPATGRELYRTDGTVTGTALVKDINPGSANGFNGWSAAIGNFLFFAANDGVSGAELWKSDGTSQGTVMVEDINPGSGHSMVGNVIAYNNLFYFKADNGVNGLEPWVSNGTAQGTFMLKDIVAGSGYSGLIEYKIGNNGSVYFLVWPVNPDPYASAADLWRSSGTTASTLRIQTIGDPDVSNEYHSFTIYDNKVYFINRSQSFTDIIWSVDGSSIGGSGAFDTPDGGINFFQAVKDHLIIAGHAQTYPIPFYRSDGSTPEEFYRLKSGGFHGGDRSVNRANIVKSGDLAFFADHDGPTDDDSNAPYDEQDYFHLFQTDGVTTQSMRALYGVEIPGVEDISDFNGKVIFTTHNDYFAPLDDFKRLWIYDPAAGDTGAGKLSVETWNGISGTQVSSIPVDSPPSSTSEITIFETPGNIGDNYGSRVRGYVIPPATGNYTFWISSDDRSELWLSTDDNPANKVRIASVSGWTNSRQWDKYTSQRSAPVSLVAGRKYYVEALLKEGTGGDHLAVGWQLPNGTLERPIPGNRLMLFQNEDPVVEFIHPADGRTFTAGESVQILLDASDSDGSIAKIELYSVDLATNEQIKLGTLQSEPYWMNWHPSSGHNYMLIAEATDNSGGSATDTVSVFAHPENSGMIQAEVWTGIPGTEISSIPLNSPPSSVLDLTTFETPANIGDNYGIRVRGYIYVLNTGDHTFWIASDDRSELWLSSDESPANKVRIAYLDGWTTPRRWDKNPTQKSAPIALVAGRRYYIEALLKEGTGNDHLAVGWQLPSGALQRPIPSQWLIPFESAPPTGTIDLETWTGISGTSISSIPVDSPPDFASELTIFETPKNVGDNYGSRVRGYIHAPTTGSYTFWVASDDRSELWLSTDENPDNKVRIAYVSGWTSSRQWDKYASQRSAPVSLVGGRNYYIEALLKEGTGGDHLAVGWQLPGGALERPIPGSRLSEFETDSEATARRTETTEEETLFSQLNIYPNPVQSGEPELRMGGYENISKTIETQVEIINMTGEVIYSEQVRCGGDCGSYVMKINKQLVPGVYLVDLKTNGTRSSKRLLVK